MSTSTAILELIYSTRYQILALLVGSVIWQQWASYRRLSQFKGPFWASLTNLWMANSVVNRKQHLDLFEVSKKYGLISITLRHTKADRIQENLHALDQIFFSQVIPNWFSVWVLQGRDTLVPMWVFSNCCCSSTWPANGKTDVLQWYAGQKLEVDHDNLISTVDDRLHTKRRAQMAIGVSTDYPPYNVELMKS
jgi:hypothetical protein